MTDFLNQSAILCTCPREMPIWLAGEIEALGYPELQILPAGVELRGSLEDAMRLNLHLRTAHRVLWLLGEFTCRGPEELYANASEAPWEQMIAADGYVSVHSRVETEAINDSRFANQRLKDAIVDRIRKVTGRRPDSGPDKSRTVIFLHWTAERCQVWLDSSGEPLAKRGYRTMPHGAPMQETLAAAVLLASRFVPGQPFVNPMCGAGTLGTEAALIALNRAPGLSRRNFGFMHVLGYEPRVFEEFRRQAREAERPWPGGPFLLSDHDPRAIQAARVNARAAGLEKLIDFQVADFRKVAVPDGPGVVVLNPEYGKRLGDEQALEAVYKAIGDFFKQSCSGYVGYVFTGNPRLSKFVGLKTSRRIPFRNAKIDCRLLEYELYAGSRKAKGED